MTRAVIFGVGGVGSHLAYLLTRVNTEWKQTHSVETNLFDEIALVDFDEVEKKNLERQMFFQTQCMEGSKKCKVLGNLLSFEGGVNADGSMEITKIDRKVTDELDLADFDREHDFAFICTDNMQSKLLIFRYFEHKIMVSCDKDYYEIKTKLDTGDTAVFEFGGENGAYSSAQTFSANVVSAMHTYRLVLRYGWTMPDMIIRQKVSDSLDCNSYRVIWNPTKKRGVVESAEEFD